MKKMLSPRKKRGEGSDCGVTTKIENVDGKISFEGNERATSFSNNGSIRYE